MYQWLIFINVIVLIIAVYYLKKRKRVFLNTLEIRESPIHGRGVFSYVEFSPGDIIEQMPIICTNNDSHPTMFADYVIGCNDGKVGIMLGHASIYNHSDNPNVLWMIDYENNTAVIKAIKRIKPGDEIFADYGSEYWSTRPLVKK
jgi:hypothetical protein